MGDLVWSTDPDQRGKFPQGGALSSGRKRQDAPKGNATPVRKHLPKGPCVSLETSGRNGKGVTLVTGISLAEDALTDLGKALRQACGSGGTVKDGVIEIQGDHREKVQQALARKGIQARRI
ncbi:MAG: translation initiation factor [Fibrobacteria bacterium]|nr:translation initiation factor [Fibrobacteria bacterium]